MARMRLALLLAACVLAFTAFEAFADAEWDTASAEHRALLGKGGEYSKGKGGGYDKPDVHKIADKIVDHVEDKIEKVAKKIVNKGKWGHGDDKGGPRHLLGSKDGKGKSGGYDKPDVHKIADKIVDHVEDKIEKVAKKIVSKGKWGHGDDKGGPRHLLGSKDGKGKSGGYDKPDVHKIADKIVDHVEDKIEKVAKKIVSKGKWGHGDDKGGPRHLLGSKDGKGKSGGYDKPDVHKIADKIVDHVEDKIEKVAKKIVNKGKWGHGDDKGGPRHLLGSKDGKGKSGGYDKPDVHKIADKIVDHVEDKIEKVAKKIVNKGKWGHGDDKGGPRHLLGSKDGKGKSGGYDKPDVHKIADKIVDHVEDKIEKVAKKIVNKGKWGHGDDKGGPRHLLGSKDGKGKSGGYDKPDVHKIADKIVDHVEDKIEKVAKKIVNKGKWGHGDGKGGPRHLLGSKDGKGKSGGYDKPDVHKIADKIVDHVEDKIEKVAKKIVSKGKWGHGDDKGGPRHLLGNKGKEGNPKEIAKIEKETEKFVKKIEKIADKADGKHGYGGGSKEGQHGKEGHKEGKWGRLLLDSKEQHHEEGKGHWGKGHGKEEHGKEQGHGKEGHGKEQGHGKEEGHGKYGHDKGGHKGGKQWGHRRLLGNKEGHDGGKGSWGKGHGKEFGDKIEKIVHKIEDKIEDKVGGKGDWGKGGHKEKWGRLLLSGEEVHHDDGKGKGGWGKGKKFEEKIEKIVDKIEKIGGKGDWGKGGHGGKEGHKPGKWGPLDPPLALGTTGCHENVGTVPRFQHMLEFLVSGD